MFLAHGPASYLANEVIQKEKISKLRTHEQLIVGIFGIIFGIFPDIDLLVLMATPFPTFRHHEIFTHTPIFYIGIWLLLLGIYKVLQNFLSKKSAKLFNPDLIQILLNTFLISTMFHLLMDLITGDIMLLYPILDTQFTLTKYLLEPSLVQGYLLSTWMAIELVIVAVFLKHIFTKYLKSEKRIQIFSNTLLIATIIYFTFSFTISRFTYNSYHLSDTNGYTNHDVDYDGISDQCDMDIYNNGKNNITEVDAGELSKNARKIVESNKLAVGESRNIWDDIKLTYGALDSTALITQAYYDTHKPLAPVLNDFYNKTDSHSYFAKYDALDILYQYLQSNGDLIELNTKSDITLPVGKIFFVLDNESNIKNTGLTLDRNEVATVLSEDTRLQPHTYVEMLSKLEDGDRIEIQ